MGRCIAVRIFLARSSVLMSAIRRSGAWHFVQTISNPNVRRKSSDQEIYLEVFLGLSCPVAGSGGEAGAGTTWLREALCDESTPKYLTVWRRGGGTKAANRAMMARGSRSTAEVPSDHGFLKSSLTLPSGRMWRSGRWLGKSADIQCGSLLPVAWLPEKRLFPFTRISDRAHRGNWTRGYAAAFRLRNASSHDFRTGDSIRV